MKKELTPEESMSKIKSQLILTHIFWASLLLKMNCRFEKSIPTACTNGIDILINPDFWDFLDSPQKKFLLSHELCHCFLKHHIRIKGRDLKIWNYAADYVVNILLENAGFTLPPGSLKDRKLENMSVESVYELIKNNPRLKRDRYGSASKEEIDKFGSSFGEVAPFPGNSSEEQANDQEWTGRLSQAIRAAKSCGKGSPFLDRLAESNKQSKIPWKEVLQRFVQVLSKNDYDWKLPNRRYMGGNIYAPRIRSYEIGKVLFFGDTSGSVGNEEMNITASEIQHACSMINAEFWIAWIDDHMQGEPIEIDKNEYPLILHPKGGGGTDFRPGFEWVDKEDFDPICVIYITDGFCNDFPKEPNYPVLWLITSKDIFKPPFGETCYYWD